MSTIKRTLTGALAGLILLAGAVTPAQAATPDQLSRGGATTQAAPVCSVLPFLWFCKD